MFCDALASEDVILYETSLVSASECDCFLENTDVLGSEFWGLSKFISGYSLPGVA